MCSCGQNTSGKFQNMCAQKASRLRVMEPTMHLPPTSVIGAISTCKAAPQDESPLTHGQDELCKCMHMKCYEYPLWLSYKVSGHKGEWFALFSIFHISSPLQEIWEMIPAGGFKKNKESKTTNTMLLLKNLRSQSMPSVFWNAPSSNIR